MRDEQIRAMENSLMSRGMALWFDGGYSMLPIHQITQGRIRYDTREGCVLDAWERNRRVAA